MRELLGGLCGAPDAINQEQGDDMTKAKLVFAAACVIGAVLAGGTVAWATIQQTGEDPIHACVSRGLLGIGEGTIRIVDFPNQCKSSEDPLSWNHQVAPAVRTVQVAATVPGPNGLFTDFVLECEPDEAAINVTLGAESGSIGAAASITDSTPVGFTLPDPPWRWYVRVVPDAGPVDVTLTLFCLAVA